MTDKKTANSTGKKSSSAGISAADSQTLSSKIEELEILIKDSLDEKNQWNNVLRARIGKHISVDLVTGESVEGCLLWIDRYTIGIKDTLLRIVHKAAIAIITIPE
jgi:sRNA-binding regulator protein Hfq